jgi:hypothetical protein
MHYEVNYAELSPAEKQEKAIADIKDFIGENRFHKLTEDFRTYGKINIEQFGFLCSITGISGYPVEAWHTHVYGASNEE